MRMLQFTVPARLATSIALVSGSIVLGAPMQNAAPAPSNDVANQLPAPAQPHVAAIVEQIRTLRRGIAAGDALAMAQHERLSAVYEALTAQRAPDSSSAGPPADRPVLAPTSRARGAGGSVRGVGGGGGGIAGISAPPGCAVDLSGLVVNDTDAAIPDPGAVTTAILISGVEGYIYFVDSEVFVTHTRSQDLDISLTSPSGTTIILSTDNGGDFDNVFNGTLFRDPVDPAGTLPYSTNAGLATDHPYANLTVATLLAPEEAFAAFNGESPNGTWTLTAADDTAGETGMLLDWDLAIATTLAPLGRATRVYTLDTSIPFGSAAGAISSNLTVANFPGAVCDVDVLVNVPHAFSEEIDMTLTSPAGEVVTLSTDNGEGFDNVFAGTLFDDEASPGPGSRRNVADTLYFNSVVQAHLTPEEPLSLLSDTSPNGVWTLTLNDDFVLEDDGILEGWSLVITTCSCDAPCPGDLNGDGVTNVTDLLRLITLWGGCP